MCLGVYVYKQCIYKIILPEYKTVYTAFVLKHYKYLPLRESDFMYVLTVAKYV